MFTAIDYDRHYANQAPTELLNTFREHADRFLHVMKLVRQLQPGSILDIACNRGFFGSLVQWRHGYSPSLVVGVDFSKTALDSALVNGYDRVHEIDVNTSFDLRQKFDMVFCMEILEHVPVPQMVIMNAFRHAREYILFSTPEETEPVDGEIHVRYVSIDHLEALVTFTAQQLGIVPKSVTPHFLPSLFCEKPRWAGWNFILVEL